MLMAVLDGIIGSIDAKRESAVRAESRFRDAPFAHYHQIGNNEV